MLEDIFHASCAFRQARRDAANDAGFLDEKVNVIGLAAAALVGELQPAAGTHTDR